MSDLQRCPEYERGVAHDGPHVWSRRLGPSGSGAVTGWRCPGLAETLPEPGEWAPGTVLRWVQPCACWPNRCDSATVVVELAPGEAAGYGMPAAVEAVLVAADWSIQGRRWVCSAHPPRR